MDAAGQKKKLKIALGRGGGVQCAASKAFPRRIPRKVNLKAVPLLPSGTSPPPVPLDPVNPDVVQLAAMSDQLRDLAVEYTRALETLQRVGPGIAAMAADLARLDASQPAVQRALAATNLPARARMVCTRVLSGSPGFFTQPAMAGTHGVDWLLDIPRPVAVSLRALVEQWRAYPAVSCTPPIERSTFEHAWAAARARRILPSSTTAFPQNAKRPLPAVTAATVGMFPVSTTTMTTMTTMTTTTATTATTTKEDRKKAVRAFAAALATPSAPRDVGAAIERLLFERYCLPGGPVTDDYFRRAHAIWEHLAPGSTQCRPLLRYMVMTGVLGPGELVTCTPEELCDAEAEAKAELVVCRPGWLERIMAAERAKRVGSNDGGGAGR